MQKLTSAIKRINFFRVLTVFFAGVILFVSTACGSAGVQAKGLDNNPRPEVPDNAITNTYKGGMNDYSDVDPRRDTSGAKAKSKALIDNAEHNIQKRADSPEDYARNYRSGTPLGERVENLAEDVSESAKNTAEGVSKGTQRGIENIKENTENATEDVADNTRKSANNAKNNTANTGENLIDKAQEAVGNLTGLFQDKTDDASRAANNAGR